MSQVTVIGFWEKLQVYVICIDQKVFPVCYCCFLLPYSFSIHLHGHLLIELFNCKKLKGNV